MSKYDQVYGVPMSIQSRKSKTKSKPIMGYRYSCKRSHRRTEQQPLAGPLPWCTVCHMTYGEMNRLEYRGRVKIGIERK